MFIVARCRESLSPLDSGDGSALAENVTGTTHICAHGEVEGAFDDVLAAVRAHLLESQLDVVPRDELHADFEHHGMARLCVRIAGGDASLLLFQLVGGRQEPVTELAIAVGDEGGTQPSALACTRLLEKLVLVLQQDVRAVNRVAIASR